MELLWNLIGCITLAGFTYLAWRGLCTAAQYMGVSPLQLLGVAWLAGMLGWH